MMKKLLYAAFIVVFLSTITNNVKAQYITTVAGTGTGGFSGDGFAAISANINSPFGIAADGAGNIYFADSANHCIRKVNAATSVISTVAGIGGSAGNTGDNGQATAAKLNSPVGVAVDGSGNIYISDQGNSRVRRVSAATGIITTVAGNGTAGYVADNVAATSTRINRPYAVALDATGNFYIADYGNNRIRKVTVSTGIITTFAGTGLAGFFGDGAAATTARFRNPEGLAFDASGNLYIADCGNNRIRVVNTSGIINTVAGNATNVYAGDGIPATATGLNGPVGIAFDAAGNYYIADVQHHSVRVVDIATNLINTAAGDGTAGYNNDCISPFVAQLNMPTGLAFDGLGNLFITDRNNNRVRKIAPPCSGTPSPGIVNTTAANGCTSYIPTLSLSGASSGCDISFQWESSNDGSSFTPIAGATSATYSDTVTAPIYYDCIVTCGGSGLSANSTSVFLDVTDTIHLTPITGPDSLCPATTITLSETVSGGIWSATNTNASVSSTGVVLGNVAGIDTIIYTATNICGTVKDSAIITVNPIVTPFVSISLSTGSTTVCAGTSVIYTGNAINGGVSPAYTWYINGLFSGVGNSLTYTPVSGDMITCTLTSNAPCPTSMTATTSVTMTVTAFVPPTMAISSGIYGDTVCSGTTLTYTSSVTNGGFTPNYDWTVNGILLVTGPGSTFTYTPSAGDIIVGTLTSSIACTSPGQRACTEVIINFQIL